VLHRKNAPERVPAEERHQPSRVIDGVGRIGEDDVECMLGQSLSVPHGVSPMYGDDVLQAEGGDVLIQGAE